MSIFLFSIERDSLRERERQARAQMSSQESELQETVPMFGPPVKVLQLFPLQSIERELKCLLRFRCNRQPQIERPNKSKRG
jgi:hypothetical protein